MSTITGYLSTVWGGNFARVCFCALAIICVLRKLVFEIRTDWFFLLGINFFDFQKGPDKSLIFYRVRAIEIHIFRPLILRCAYPM